MSDTPRTDRAATSAFSLYNPMTTLVYASFARQLERELAAMTAEREMLRDALDSLHVLLEGGDSSTFMWYANDPFAREARAKAIAALNAATKGKE